MLRTSIIEIENMLCAVAFSSNQNYFSHVTVCIHCCYYCCSVGVPGVARVRGARNIVYVCNIYQVRVIAHTYSAVVMLMF